MIDFGFTVEPKWQSQKLVDQVHGNSVYNLDTPSASLPQADAIVTATQKTIYIFTADCLPVLIFQDEPYKKAAVHCGWRGARLNIVAKTLEFFDVSKPIQAILGPAIMPCCFEVKEDFIQEFEKMGHEVQPFLTLRETGMYFDLPKFVIETQLKGCEVNTQQLRCTYCSEPKLPSYRREKEKAFRLKSWI